MQLDAADVQTYAAALPDAALHDWVERAASEEEAAAGEQADGTGERDPGADAAATGAMVDADDNLDESAWLGPSGYYPWRPLGTPDLLDTRDEQCHRGLRVWKFGGCNASGCGGQSGCLSCGDFQVAADGRQTTSSTTSCFRRYCPTACEGGMGGL